MAEYLFKRLALAIPTLVLAMTVVFLLARVVPGDPAMVILGDQASAESLAALREQLGLDQSLALQYLDFLGGLFRGDLGQSLVTGKSVWAEVLAVIPYTIELTLAAIFIGVIFGIPLGVYAAVHRNRLPDTLTRLVSLAGLSFPAFVSAILLLLVFSIQLKWFPVISAPRWGDPLDHLRNLVLPAMNLGLIMTAYVTRVARSSMLNVLGEDYVRTARAKGIGAAAVMWRHALRNALVPVATVVGLYLGTMIGNSVLTEIVFNRPGLGKLILGALNQRDYTLLQGLMVFFAGFLLNGADLAQFSEGQLDTVRGNRLAMIFQEPMTALNPTMRVGDQVAESLRAHRGVDRNAAAREALRMLDLVKVPSAARRMRDYPHQFSGGMRQRVMIAMALACRPDVLLADEPTTALDVTIQAQVLSLIEDLKREYGLAVLFITHNLGVVALIADRVAVMYAGEIVETASAAALFESPRHPYTEALLASMPRVDSDLGALDPIRGHVPSIRERGAGCPFAPRCPLVQERCHAGHPPLSVTGPDTSVRCWVRGAA